ncbi:MAG: sodium:glutamate symporter, partial [Pirellulales bacterium]|nr:sodium:glutamate symporter [Pirellulales bacterium]
MTAALIFVAVLLLIGVTLRLSFDIFRWLYIPASVIAGLVGLFFVQTTLGLGLDPSADDFQPAPLVQQVDSWRATLKAWPKFLIAVVFAGMLLERKPSPVRESVSRVGRQGLMVWIIVLGQTAVGLLATWWFIQPYHKVPNSVGMLIETGFAGGHGTAAAMGRVYASEGIDFASGADLGILMATGGLIYGVVTGILWINIGLRRGWVPAV